jgi:hypothetical protein
MAASSLAGEGRRPACRASVSPERTACSAVSAPSRISTSTTACHSPCSASCAIALARRRPSTIPKATVTSLHVDDRLKQAERTELLAQLTPGLHAGESIEPVELHPLVPLARRRDRQELKLAGHRSTSTTGTPAREASSVVVTWLPPASSLTTFGGSPTAPAAAWVTCRGSCRRGRSSALPLGPTPRAHANGSLEHRCSSARPRDTAIDGGPRSP